MTPEQTGLLKSHIPLGLRCTQLEPQITFPVVFIIKLQQEMGVPAALQMWTGIWGRSPRIPSGPSLRATRCVPSSGLSCPSSGSWTVRCLLAPEL